MQVFELFNFFKNISISLVTLHVKEICPSVIAVIS